MANHPNRNRAPRTEVDGVRFKLSLDATGNPHMLKQWQQDRAGQLALGDRLDGGARGQADRREGGRLTSTGRKRR